MTGTSVGASALAPTPNTFNFESNAVRVVVRDGEPNALSMLISLMPSPCPRSSGTRSTCPYNA
ncbi:hypothetical protein LMG8323_03237 [Ralstonia mannitolilytica]|nr:hypothetical protein LMG8323_03237 [Ralstonia mannitolilytica]